jgi:hypothetical protein
LNTIEYDNGDFHAVTFMDLIVPFPIPATRLALPERRTKPANLQPRSVTELTAMPRNQGRTGLKLSFECES